MAGQSDPDLSLFSPSEVTKSVPLLFFLPPTAAWMHRSRDLKLPGLTQVEFVAEDEVVEIVPNIRMDALNLLCVRASPIPAFHPHPICASHIVSGTSDFPV